ncbi:MAG: alpha/beta fold hydrolase [Euzebyaceae bacterium]|nr:alpha/beta fold hydrolase [Euzebyaceae bacterium]
MTLAACTPGASPDPGGVDSPVDAVDPPRPGRSTLDWRRCGKPFECATLRVPLNHARPAGRKLGLAVIRLQAPVRDQRLGSLVVNPGGPGGSGVQFVRHGAIDAIPAELRAQFDIVGFDPRGVGRSAAVSCGGASNDLLSSDLSPDSPGEVAPLLAAARRLAQACGDRNGPLLHRMSTEDVARDLDLLREALGDRQLTYVGFSYGTFIGATYAQLFPQRTRALVLDGAVDPSLDAQQRARQQVQQLERTLGDFLDACDTEPTCPLGRRKGQSRDRFETLLAALKQAPLPVPGSGRALQASELLVATAGLLKDRGPGWTSLGLGLRLASDGDGSLLLAVADRALGQAGSGDWLGPLLAVNCLDVPAPRPQAYPSWPPATSPTSSAFAKPSAVSSTATSGGTGAGIWRMTPPASSQSWLQTTRMSWY